MKKFTIITVCLNAEEVIADTITSILNQTCNDYEYLIKDGGSKDQTLRIAESFIPAFYEKGISYRIISKPDQGIYDAMNQAAQEAQGEWVLYMNAGDLLANQNILHFVEQSNSLENADVVYGDVIYCSNGWYLLDKGLPIEKIRNQMPFCHQSVFTRRQVFKEANYSLQYRICSDYLFYRQRYREGKRFVYLPIAISIFFKGGISSDGKTFKQELLRIHEEMGDTDEEIVQYLKKQLRLCDRNRFIYMHFSRYIPKKVREKRWEYLRKARGWKRKEEFFAGIESNCGETNGNT